MRERTLETPRGIQFRSLEFLSSLRLDGDHSATREDAPARENLSSLRLDGDHSATREDAPARENGEAGKDSRSLVYFHSAGGLLPFEPLLETLATQGYHVHAPVWPGYGEEPGEEQLEDMLDFALHGWDVVDALKLGDRPVIAGHSMGGMIAAEMACLAPQRVERLVLIASAGLWLDEHPIPDLFAMLPFELAQVLFYDPKMGEAMLTGGVDFTNMKALQDFLVINARRLGTAGKILFPIPNRRLQKRLYRMSAPTLLVWGKQDKLIPPAYAERFKALLPGESRIAWIDQAGHMVPYEQTAAVASAITEFLARSASAA